MTRRKKENQKSVSPGKYRKFHKDGVISSDSFLQIKGNEIWRTEHWWIWQSKGHWLRWWQFPSGSRSKTLIEWVQREWIQQIKTNIWGNLLLKPEEIKWWSWRAKWAHFLRQEKSDMVNMLMRRWTAEGNFDDVGEIMDHPESELFERMRQVMI